MITLAEETPADWWEVEALYDLCFAPGREGLSSYRLRHGVDPIPELCLTLRDADGVLAAASRSWPVRIGGPEKAVLFGPIAVHPIHQGEGLGAWLIYRSIEVARARGWRRMMLVGDPPYYGRFGFTRLTDVVMPPPTNPARVLGLDLLQDGWKGIAGQVRRATKKAGGH